MRRRRHVLVAFGIIVFLAVGAPSWGQLIPRTLPTKPTSVSEPDFAAILIVKFMDDLKVRAAGGNLSSPVGADLSNIEAVQAQFTLTFEPSIHVPQATLAAMEAEAALRSGIAQPDLAGMMEVSGPAGTIEAAANGLLALAETEWVEFTDANPEPPCDDIGEQTCDFFSEQDYHGPDPGMNMSYAWTQGARGQGIQIADAEFGYIRGHEDLCNINEPAGQEFDTFLNHGTAVLGELVGLDTPGNQYGVKGLVPDATAWFFSEDSQTPIAPPEPQNRNTAICQAIEAVDAGDIVLLEMQTRTKSFFQCVGHDFCWVPAEVRYPVWLLVKCGTHAGRIIVAAAGNGWEDLDSTWDDYADWRSWGDSGSIIVGAGQDSTSHDRLGFSTYGSRVNVQGWGRGVFTLGYGTQLSFECPRIIDIKQSYATNFGGTSSASPFVVAAAASLQSLAEAEFGCRIGPRQMRRLLIETGICQGEASLDKHIGSFPNMFSSIARLRELGELPGADCNGNGVSDVCDVGIAPAGGPPAFADANHDLVPDVCEPNGDCNTNGTPDLEDIGTGTSRDCNGNNMPDECDLASGTSADCNANGFPDDCEVSPSCIDQVPSSDDCNANGVPDECDIASGTSLDCEGNGIPDECVESCVVANAPTTEPGGVAKNRYASFVPGNGGADTAIRVTLTSLPSPFTSFNGTKMWVDAPVERCENAATLTPPCSNPTDSFWASRLVCDPVYLDWSVYGTIHIYDDEIVPGATYGIKEIGCSCDTAVESGFSVALSRTTSALWGDITGFCNEYSCTPPDGTVDIVDASAVADKFGNLPESPSKTWADLAGDVPSLVIDIFDMVAALDAVNLLPYPYDGPATCGSPPPGGGGEEGEEN